MPVPTPAASARATRCGSRPRWRSTETTSTETTTPLEADLAWIVKLDKGDFVGRDVLQRDRQTARTASSSDSRWSTAGIARHGYPVVEGSQEIGVVTSGTHSPTLKKAIGLAYLPLDKSAPGTEFAGPHPRKRNSGPCRPDAILQTG